MTEGNSPNFAETPLEPQLAALVSEGRLGHAYIFAGQEALAQALALGQAVNCPNGQNGQPCGHCPSCKKVSDSCHADCQLFFPEKNAHRLESMRRLQAAAWLEAYEGGKKIFIVEGAELLLEEAANTLLKLLEEPPPDTVLILVCANWDRLLPTIRSRCQLFVFGVGANVVLEEARVEANRAQAESFLRRLPGLTLAQAMQESRQERDKEEWLHYLAALMRLLSAAVKGELELPMSYANALKAALLMDNTLDLLRRNINQKLLLDIVYLRLWQYTDKQA